MYKDAARLKLRFNTSKGSLAVEQLFDLSQTEIANCIRSIKKLLKKNDDDELSFLDQTNKVDTTEQLRFDILKDIYLTKKKESEDARNEAEVKQFEQRIMALISEKEEDNLRGKSLDELKAMLKK
jgi:hypothetical protein